MALRGRLPDQIAAYPQPIYGVDLRSSWSDVQPGYGRLLQNVVYDGGLLMRKGSTKLTTASLGSFKGRGGAVYYYGTSSKKRLVAYDTKIAVIADDGTASNLTTGMTSDKDTHFRTWPVTDSVYISNNTDAVRLYDGTTFSTLTGTNIPTGFMVTGYQDRLFCIQGKGVVNTNPRVDNVWSPTTSTWSYYVPTAGAGRPTALALHSAGGKQSGPTAQLLIFQSTAVTALVGTNFDPDVTAATPTTAWDAQFLWSNSRIGTLSPYSIVSVPDFGTFWFTQDKQVAFLPFMSVNVQYISDFIWSNQANISGVNSANSAAINQVAMVYHDRKLKLFLPVASNAYPTVQYWLDFRYGFEKPHWSGPHIGQSVGRVWVEDQAGDDGTLYGLEGNSATGMFVYKLNQTNTWTDAVGTSNHAIVSEYDTFFHSMGAPSRAKWLPRIRLACQGDPNIASVTLRELHGNQSTGPFDVHQLDGSMFATAGVWGDSGLWGDGGLWGGASGFSTGEVWPLAQDGNEYMGDRVSVEITATSSGSSYFGIDSILPEAQIKPNLRVN